MSAFVWRTGTSYPVKAQQAGEHLEAMEKAHGHVTAQMVLDDSRPEEAVLHPCFEWDDEVAAEKWRKQEARELIGNLVIVHLIKQEEEGPKEVQVRAFSNVQRQNEGAVYRSTITAMHEDESRDRILENARREMEIYARKYKDLVDIVKLAAEVTQ